MTKLSPAQRVLRARIAAYALHAQRDPKATTAPARAAFLERFERQVDPDRRLSRDERLRRALAARRAYMTRLAFASSRARNTGARRS